MIRNKYILVFALCFIFLSQNYFAQEVTETETEEKPKSQLIETGEYQTSELASLHIDMLRKAMGYSSNSKGYIIVYCGKNCSYGEVEAHLRGIYLSLRGKGVNSKDFVYFHGGFREKLTVEYWLVPENACLPQLDSTVEIKDVKFKGKFKTTLVPYDCCY